MGIDVRWEEGIDSHLLGELLDEDSLVERFLTDVNVKDLPNLRFIGFHTLTVFHQRHIPQLIEELEKLSVQAHEPEVGRHLRAVLDFVRQAHGWPGSHICFSGK